MLAQTDAISVSAHGRRIVGLAMSRPARFLPKHRMRPVSPMSRYPTSSTCRKASTWAKPWVWPRTPYDNAGEIYKMELDGTIIGRFGTGGKRLGEFGSVHAIDCRNPDELLVAEITTWRVQKILLDPRMTSQ